MRRAILFVVALAIAGCEQHQPVCVPKHVADCFCATGERGTQTCSDDGYGYGTCACTPDAGAPGDGAMDGQSQL